MSSQKPPLSATKRAVPIKIKVLNPSDRDNFPYNSLEPRWSFTMTLMPLTKIRELCIHAVGQVQRTFNAVMEAARLEARDRDGHVFHGMETIAEEILNGETIYLIETESTGKGKGKERGRLLSLRTGAEQAYRTPSASSRSSSQSRRKAQSQPKPRLTPSQRALAIAKAGRSPRSEPVRSRRPSISALDLDSVPSLPSPGSPHIGPAAASKDFSKGRNDASSVICDAPTILNQDTPVVRSQQSSPPPETSPRLQDSQKVVPDSQVSPPGSPFLPPSASRAKSGSAVNSKPNASELSPGQPRSAPPLNTLDPDNLQNIPPTSTRTSKSRPDPYDISTVLSDDETYSPKRLNSIMSSSVRKLGSASKRRPPASQPPMRQPQLNINPPSRISKSAAVDRSNSIRNIDFMNPATPTRKTTAHNKADASSPAAALPSSPTNNVAAVIARGRDKIKRRPVPECVVIDDSEDEIDEDLFRNPPGLSASYPEALLPWSQPPLRATQDESLDVRPVARRGSMSGIVKAVVEDDVFVEKDDLVDSKADVRRLIDAAKETLAAARDSGKLRAREMSSSAFSPFHLKSPVKSPSKTAPTTPAGKEPSGQAMIQQSNVTVVHSSSSAEEDREAHGNVRFVKEERSDDESWKDLPAAVPPESASHQDHDDKGKGIEVIELSSDSDSSIDPAWPDDYDVEPPALPELPATHEPLPPDPRSRDIELPVPLLPVQATNNIVTDPIEPRVNESPPSAQPDKRKRLISDEPNSEDERRRKKARRVEKKKAKKALRNAKRREAMARLEEERKRLALEQAYRRALELEMTVSSPSKAKERDSGDNEVEADDDSGPGIGELDEDKYVEDVRIPLYGNDDNDTLSSKETEDRVLWLHKHLTPSSPESNQDSPRSSADVVRQESPACEDADAPQQAHQQHHGSDDMDKVGNQYFRKPFDDWAALEATLGTGGFGYSPLEVHNRIHLATVHRCLQAQREPSQEPSQGISDQDSWLKSPLKPVTKTHPSPRSFRSGAPLSKDTPPAQQAASTRGTKKGGKGKESKHKSWARRERNRKRLQSRMRADHYYSHLRDTIYAKNKNH
ncbi:hypothetical protein VMCG_10408 [Cytospora schulzeri]|uniref:Uncharacterized protein n=1 Tax=Cytospora schulzeri TaxID=448051 RepID=A0A423VB58_9PEZI|nr:hypothetical protein VMCG_10408 [Valsa malicola]